MRSNRHQSPLPSDLTAKVFDVLVIGGGNAALCAAITAREAGASVLLLESAPRHFRGGNSRHTRNLRYLHANGNSFLTGPYTESEFWEDLMRVTEGQTNEALARLTIQKSNNIGEWMQDHGCKFQPAMRGTLHLARTNAFFLGGGKALMNAYYARAEDLGVQIVYKAEALDLTLCGRKFVSATVDMDNVPRKIKATSLIVASGGFQANRKWLKKYWGKAADNFIIRGTPYDTGKMLSVLLDNHIKPVGDPTQCHCVAIDARAPKSDGGIVTRLDCVSYGIVVNKNADRFYDEGEDFWPKRYAIWGRLVARQPDQIAYSIIDAKSIDLFMPSAFPPFQADTIPELARKLSIEPAGLEQTVNAFNHATRPCHFAPDQLDGCSTREITPVKSNWARPLDTPPYYGYPLRPGITFTYLGVSVDEKARMIMTDGEPADNMFAAGEIMSGNILGKGYMAGFGMTIGTVFGKIAGEEAAKHVSDHFERS